MIKPRMEDRDGERWTNESDIPGLEQETADKHLLYLRGYSNQTLGQDRDITGDCERLNVWAQ